MRKNEIRVKKNLEIEAVALVLEKLVESLRTGTVCVESENEFVTLSPAGVLDLELSASQKKNKGKLVLELNWRNVVGSDHVQSVFNISSIEPELSLGENSEEESMGVDNIAE
jgi:amphi-Trp domain-containing protein